MTMVLPEWPSEHRSLCLFVPGFSAQALAAFHPGLKNRAFVVLRQDPFSHKSTVWSCSPQARQQGIAPRALVMDIKKKYPKLTVLKRNDVFEKTILEDLKTILRDTTPDFEIKERGVVVGDISHLRDTAIQAKLQALKKDVLRKTSLSHLSIGVSAARTVAWILARVAAPGGIRICPPGEEAGALRFLPCSFLPALSWTARSRLKKYGIQKIGQLQQLDRDALLRRFGAEGDRLYAMVRGVNFKLKPAEIPPLFTETVFPKDIIHHKAIIRRIMHTADRLSFQLQVRDLLADRITFLLRYTDHRTSQRTGSLPVPASDFFALDRLCRELFSAVYRRRVAIKSIRLIVKKPFPSLGPGRLIETGAERKRRSLQAGVTRVRQRFHFTALLQGGQMEVQKNGPAEKKPRPAGRKSPDPQNRLYPLSHRPPPGFLVGISSPTALHRFPFTFGEITHTRYQPAIKSDFKRIAGRTPANCHFSVLVHHKVMDTSFPDIPAGRDRLARQMAAVSPLWEQGRFYSFILEVDHMVIRSQRMLRYLVEVCRLPVRQGFDVHLQLSHPGWSTPYVTETLREEGIGICNTGPGPFRATTSKGYLRHTAESWKEGKNPHQPVYSHLELKDRTEQLAVVFAGNSSRFTAARATRLIHLLRRCRSV